MKENKYKVTLQHLIDRSDVRLNGSRPWDIQIHDNEACKRIISQGSLGLGETYMEGLWDCEAVDEFMFRILRSGVRENFQFNWVTLKTYLQAKFFNLQNLKHARKVVERHYDLGNELYMSFLDPYNQYTCGYFKNTEDLNTAQVKKLELICAKLQLNKNDTVLDIGCGWGGFAKFAAERFGCEVTGITLSGPQGFLRTRIY